MTAFSVWVSPRQDQPAERSLCVTLASEPPGAQLYHMDSGGVARAFGKTPYAIPPFSLMRRAKRNDLGA